MEPGAMEGTNSQDTRCPTPAQCSYSTALLYSTAHTLLYFTLLLILYCLYTTASESIPQSLLYCLHTTLLYSTLLKSTLLYSTRVYSTLLEYTACILLLTTTSTTLLPLTK